MHHIMSLRPSGALQSIINLGYKVKFRVVIVCVGLLTSLLYQRGTTRKTKTRSSYPHRAEPLEPNKKTHTVTQLIPS